MYYMVWRTEENRYNPQDGRRVSLQRYRYPNMYSDTASLNNQSVC
jgi:hypothetical protein